MRVLVTNDDGIYAAGLAALCRAARVFGEVWVVAPMAQQSGVGHGITLTRPLRALRVERDGDFVGYGVTGTPADCVKLAISGSLAPRPHLILSGVNDGSNTGIHVLYSGTVGAAVEGAMLGVPSVAVSVDFSDDPDLDTAAEVGCAVVRPMVDRLAEGLDVPKVLNVNVPALPRDRIRGVRLNPQCVQAFTEAMERRSDPRGADYYWLTAGDVPDDVGAGTDCRAVRDGYVSVTPLQFDMTDHDWLGRMSSADLGQVGESDPQG